MGLQITVSQRGAAMLGRALFLLGIAYIYYRASLNAYDIRLYAIKIYGRVIHEFDPWFNYRATVYLADNGWYKFSRWFDYTAWYPLGRPVGTTIYPGMQITSVAIWNALNALGGKWAMTLNDVCCFVPAWFGVSASILLGLLTGECSGSATAGAAACMIMAIVPAHIMRSVGGGYDNESIALTAMCGTFYCWVRALRSEPGAKDGEATTGSVVFGVLTGLAYIYMVAAWGGFVFVLNMIGMHAAVLIACGRFSSKLHRAFSLFYVIGTLGAIQVPVVGWGPLKSLEQLGPLAIFVGMQVLEVAAVQKRKRGLTNAQALAVLLKAALPVLVVASAVVVALHSRGHFGPFSSRVRGLFVKHTRTGNPLVDSVAEHQPANEQAYQHYLHHVYSIVPFGLLVSLLQQTDSNSFLTLYALVGYYFANKMARLIILLGPVASALGGVAIGFLADQLLVHPVGKLLMWPLSFGADAEPAAEAAAAAADKEGRGEAKDEEVKKAKGAAKKGAAAAPAGAKAEAPPASALSSARAGAKRLALGAYNHPLSLLLRLGVGLWCVRQAVPKAKEFFGYSHQLAEGFSQPSIMFKARLNTGEEIMVDDYREAYWWLRDHTPADARVMAWWDYGYQITGIGNRTTIADGNTWNHEHIALLGRCLVSSENESHAIVKHLADYVLIWTTRYAGMYSDDLAKSPHMARIAGSVYGAVQPQKFYMDAQGNPSEMMKESILWRMHGHKYDPRVAPLEKFAEAYTTTNRMVRIYKVLGVSKKSKDWRAENGPGYPPALEAVLAEKNDFKQIHGF